MLTSPAFSASFERSLFSSAFCARKRLLMDWHEHLHAVVASSLSTMPGANVFLDGRYVPILFLPLQSGPGVTLSGHYVGPFPDTPQGNC